MKKTDEENNDEEKSDKKMPMKKNQMKKMIMKKKKKLKEEKNITNIIFLMLDISKNYLDGGIPKIEKKQINILRRFSELIKILNDIKNIYETYSLNIYYKKLLKKFISLLMKLHQLYHLKKTYSDNKKKSTNR